MWQNTAKNGVSSMTKINKSILRAYDIRGIYGENITEEVAELIGKAFATIAVRKSGVANAKIVTARDGRLSSPALADALIKGLQSTGANVIDLGVGPSPLCYFAHQHLQADGAIMLTGSHNPSEYNGFKMICGEKPFYGDDIIALGELAEAQDFVVGDAQQLVKLDLRGEYVAKLLTGFDAKGAKPLKVVWDAGNGAAGEITQILCERLKGEHIIINAEIDGTFPNHHPDPTIAKNLVQLIEAVKTHKADFGVAFDGDGDRIGAVDAHGNILWGDQMLVLFAREILARKAGATVIADVKASQTLFDEVAKHGGVPIMWKTGHSHIKAKMKETKAEIAGEMSGHIFFSDGYLGYDDGVYAAVRLLNILAHNEQNLSEMRASIPQTFNTPEIKVECDDVRKFTVIEEIRNRLHQNIKNGATMQVNEVDGLRVNVDGGWWLVRASNTQPAIIVRCEAMQEQSLNHIIALVANELQQSGLELKIH
jgi:phosphomannomutase